jgi:hypothetical protein
VDGRDKTNEWENGATLAAERYAVKEYFPVAYLLATLTYHQVHSA